MRFAAIMKQQVCFQVTNSRCSVATVIEVTEAIFARPTSVMILSSPTTVIWSRSLPEAWSTCGWRRWTPDAPGPAARRLSGVDSRNAAGSAFAILARLLLSTEETSGQGGRFPHQACQRRRGDIARSAGRMPVRITGREAGAECKGGNRPLPTCKQPPSSAIGFGSVAQVLS